MGPYFLVITLTPPLSREPGEGVTWSRPDKGLFGAESTEDTEELKSKNPKMGKSNLPFFESLSR
jgi:hypothetical protein